MCCVLSDVELDLACGVRLPRIVSAKPLQELAGRDGLAIACMFPCMQVVDCKQLQSCIDLVPVWYPCKQRYPGIHQGMVTWAELHKHSLEMPESHNTFTVRTAAERSSLGSRFTLLVWYCWPHSDRGRCRGIGRCHAYQG